MALVDYTEIPLATATKTVLKNRWPIAGGDAGTCKKCGAAMIWIRTSNNKSMPISTRTEPGTVNGKHVQPSLITYDGETWGYAHHIDCPNAAEFRR